MKLLTPNSKIKKIKFANSQVVYRITTYFIHNTNSVFIIIK